MPIQPQDAEPDAGPGPHDQGQSRHGRLLGLVRRILDYGRDLVASLQRQNTPTPAMEVSRRFGTLNLALIIARITRGLRLAAALESRLVRYPPVREAARTAAERPDQPARVRPVRKRAKHPTAPLEPEDDATLLRRLPSAEDIAARIRRRSAGAVIVEICRDLGIDTSHSLWCDIRDAIIQYDGSLAKMLKIWVYRSVGLPPELLDDVPDPRPSAWHGPLPASTGPP